MDAKRDYAFSKPWRFSELSEERKDELRDFYNREPYFLNESGWYITSKINGQIFEVFYCPYCNNPTFIDSDKCPHYVLGYATSDIEMMKYTPAKLEAFIEENVDYDNDFGETEIILLAAGLCEYEYRDSVTGVGYYNSGDCYIYLFHKSEDDLIGKLKVQLRKENKCKILLAEGDRYTYYSSSGSKYSGLFLNHNSMLLCCRILPLKFSFSEENN